MTRSRKPRNLARLLVAGVLLAVLALLYVSFSAPLRSVTTFRKADDYPLYVMHLYGRYSPGEFPGTAQRTTMVTSAPQQGKAKAWACTVFAALNADGELLLGRNFDWFNRPALLLFTHPPNGYASVSLVDISYLGFDTKAPSFADRFRLLDAPHWPFDGMNEWGLAIGMMAVPYADEGQNQDRATVGSLAIMRLILDRARDVEEAVALLQAYNIDWEGGPPLHYLVADAGGQSAVIEFVDGKTNVLWNEDQWQVATNFLLSGHQPEEARGLCPRYARAYEVLRAADGAISQQEAMGLLSDVAQAITMWSVVYDLENGEISVAMGRDYGQTHPFQLKMMQQSTAHPSR